MWSRSRIRPPVSRQLWSRKIANCRSGPVNRLAVVSMLSRRPSSGSQQPSDQHPRRIRCGGGVCDPAGDLSGNRSIAAQQGWLLVQSEHGARGQHDLSLDSALSRHQPRTPTATVCVAAVGIGGTEGVERGVGGGEIIRRQGRRARPTGPAGLRSRTNRASGAVVTGRCGIVLCCGCRIVLRARDGIGSGAGPISGQRLVDLLEHDCCDRARVTVVTAHQRVAFHLVIHVLGLLSRTAHPQRGRAVDLAAD